MKRLGLIVCILAVLMPSLMAAEEVSLIEISKKVADKGMTYVDLGDYKGSVYLQGLTELALASGDEQIVAKVEKALSGYVSGERKGRGNFTSYIYGGTSVAELHYRGYEAYAALATEAADRMWKEQKRNADGHMVPAWDYIDEKNPVFVDVLLAVTPLFLYEGLKENRQEYVDYAVWSLIDVLNVLADKETGLYHQARAVKALGKDEISMDCWSRGNGWASLAYAALLHDLPASHPQYGTVCNMARKFFKAVAKYQDADGLWHQEMTMHDSFVESSGSALLLYGLGAAIEEGILPRSYVKTFEKGLSGLLTYISERGDVGNVCWSCLAEGDCSKQAYASHIHYANEAHGFGTVLLALSQALRLGIGSLETELGCNIKAPACHVRLISERREDIAWENDMCSFRIYSRVVKDKVSSGVDYWAKKVHYPTFENWYALNAQKQPYHIDRGEGCDFYAVGRKRGLGGSGVVDNGALVCPEPYADYRIYKDGPEELEFEIFYQPYRTGDDVIYHKKRIRMLLGTCFYQVTETVESESGRPVMLGAGLTDFGKAEVTESVDRGLIALQELIDEEHGQMGCAVFVDPSRVKEIIEIDGDRLLVIPMQSGDTVTYYVGAGWEKDVRWTVFEKKWPKTVSRQSWVSLEDFYNRR